MWLVYLITSAACLQLPNLRVFNLSYCHQLSRLPNTVGELMNLESFILYNCITLTLLPTSMDKLQCLQLLDLQGCMSFVLSNLRCPYRLIAIPKMIALQKLVLSGCDSLDGLPENISQLTSLTVLDLGRCSRLSSLPRSIGQLHKLEKLLLSRCVALTSLPTAIGGLTQLNLLHLENCTALASIPLSIGKLSKLEELSLRGCIAIRSFSDFVSDFVYLAERMCWNSYLHIPCFKQLKILNKMLAKRLFQMEVIRNFYETVECSRDLLFSKSQSDLHRLYNRDVFAYRCHVHQGFGDTPKIWAALRTVSQPFRFQTLDFIGPRKNLIS